MKHFYLTRCSSPYHHHYSWRFFSSISSFGIPFSYLKLDSLFLQLFLLSSNKYIGVLLEQFKQIYSCSFELCAWNFVQVISIGGYYCGIGNFGRGYLVFVFHAPGGFALGTIELGVDYWWSCLQFQNSGHISTFSRSVCSVQERLGCSRVEVMFFSF